MKKAMKLFACAILASAISIALAGCNGNGDKEDADEHPSSEHPAETEHPK